jgi:hypothetical protein
MNEIIDNLKATKGETYSNGLLLLFNVANYSAMVLAMIDVSEDTQDEMDKASGRMLCDTCKRVADLINPEANELEHTLLMKSLTKDAQTLFSKQEEYTENN